MVHLLLVPFLGVALSLSLERTLATMTTFVLRSLLYLANFLSLSARK
jgi:hypothetical protein